MEFIQTAATGSDETAPFTVLDYKSKTVIEFINEVIEAYPYEWGKFTIKQEICDYWGRGNYWVDSKVEYADGKLSGVLKEGLNDLEIEKIYSSGGWSRMDYVVYTKKRM